MTQTGEFTILRTVADDPASRWSDKELANLNSQRRTFNRLDWWSPFEWQQSDAFVVGTQQGRICGAMLFLPVDFDNINTLASTHSASAWIKWCGIADGVSATGLLATLFQSGHQQLSHAGIRHSYCIVEPNHWLYPYLRDGGYHRVDEVITMACRQPIRRMVRGKGQQSCTVRRATLREIPEIVKVDASAFEEQWQYPAAILQRASTTSAYLSVAEHEGRIVGYQLSSCTDGNAHITRLAVHTDYQGRGIGSALLVDSVYYLQSECAAKTVTINTQASNRISQRLYQRHGFSTMQPVMHVLRKSTDSRLSQVI